jgi:hypothetical protein
VLSAAILAAGLAASAAACDSGSASGKAGGTAPSPSASKDPLAGLHSGQIFDKALTNTKQASSVRIHVTGTDSGRKLTVDYTIVRGQGCQGTLAETGQGSAMIVYDGKALWVKGDKAFWVSSGGNDPAVLSIVLGKYIKITDKKSFTGIFTPFCDLKQLLSHFPADAPDLPLTHTTIGGQPAVELKDIGDPAAMYVSDTATPTVLRVSVPGSGGGDMRFSEYGATTALTYPPAGKVLDGSKYGI